VPTGSGVAGDAERRPAVREAVLALRPSWPYDEALEEMAAARDAVVAGGPMTIFVGDHREEVVTLGRHAPEEQLLGRAALEARGVLVRRIERGGGATAHGPGQLVVYPIIHLARCGLDVTGLTRALLEAAVDLAAEQGCRADLEVVIGERGHGCRPAGVYAAIGKLASIGFRVERGVVTHGLAVNIDNDLALFGLIAPCGHREQAMASLSSLGAEEAPLSRVARRLGFHVARRCVLALSMTAMC
jgi:lipoate-protein ligase B